MFEYAGVGIRPIEDSDLERMVVLRSEPSVWRNLGNIEMITLRQQQTWFRHLLNTTRAKYYILYSAEIDFIGIVRTDEIDYINRSIRVGGDIAPVYQGKGFGTRMFKLLKTYCFDYLNMNRMWLLVLETNHVAIRLYHNAGFMEEGRQRKAIYRHGQYCDYLMMSLLKSEYHQENAQ